MRDVERLTALLGERWPDLAVAQLQVPNPGDDDGLWFFRPAEGVEPEVQVESPDGQLPFLIEGPGEGQRATASTLDQAAETLDAWFRARG